MLELDEETGLRDYDITYELTGTGNGITVDPYFGKKIAGGYYVSGEASYIEYIGGWYFLFVTYGGLTAGGVKNDYNNGGYQMRVFRSESPVVNFMLLKMNVTFEDGADPKAVMQDVLANCKKVEDDCEIYL